MKFILVLISLFAFSCKKVSEKTVSEKSPVPFNTPSCAEAAHEVIKLSDRPAIEIASKMIELSTKDAASTENITSCLDTHLKITCSTERCLVAKKNK